MVALSWSRSASAPCLSRADCRDARSFSSSCFFFSRSRVSCCLLLLVPFSVPAGFPAFTDGFALGMVVPPLNLCSRDCSFQFKYFLGRTVFFPPVFLRDMPVTGSNQPAFADMAFEKSDKDRSWEISFLQPLRDLSVCMEYKVRDGFHNVYLCIRHFHKPVYGLSAFLHVIFCSLVPVPNAVCS